LKKGHEKCVEFPTPAAAPHIRDGVIGS